MAPPRAAVFDLDGTLVRSMEQHHRAYVEIFRRLGKEVAFREVCLREGMRSFEVIHDLARVKGVAVTWEEARALGEEKQRLFRSYGFPAPYPHAFEVVERLARRGLAVALVTGTNRENTRHMLGKSLDVFQAVVTGDDVKAAKPDPEPYRKAFEALGISAAEAVVVENAPYGIQSAKRAGARVVAVASTLPAPDLFGADVVVPSLFELEEAVFG